MELDQMSRYIETLRTLAVIDPRSIRKAAGLDQADMACRLGISASGVSRLEAGNRKPSPAIADAWLKALTELMHQKKNDQGQLARRTAA